MTDAERDATLQICLLAGFADGAKDEREREQLKRVATSLSSGGAVDLARAYQDVLLGRARLEDAASALTTPEVRQLAYEMAVIVCDADGARGPEEAAFLERLRAALRLDPGASEAFAREADAIASAPLEAGPVAAPAAGAADRVVASQPADPAALEEKIRNYAILNGALELLPQSLATMAIVPLQMKLVYEVGQAHGYALDRGHVKDFLATAGVGLGSQYVEELGRKLVGGLLGKLGGGLLGGLGRQATGSAMSFATTYALGQVARRYYAGGRTMSADLLRETYRSLLGEAQALRGRYAGEIEGRARTIDPAKILAMVRGGAA